ncbi:MAG: FHA domain-containing protein [Planctomycetota bacterium]
MARLVGESGSVAGKEWPIEVGVTLGREAHNTIGMPDNRKASRDHAKVWKEGPGKYSVADLGSTNGTLVNDDRVTRQALVDGDELRVGEFTFRFLLDDDEKPKKKEGPARLTEVLGGKPAGDPFAPAAAAAPSAVKGAPGSQGGAGGPTIEVKQRLLQYSKKQAGGSVAGWDLSQASTGTRWLFYGVALAIAAGLYFLVTTLITR